MDHPSDSQLVEHVQSGSATGSPVDEHLRTCGDCQQRLAAMEALWTQLGHWQVPPAPAGLESRILAALPGPRAAARPQYLFKSLRVAAALLLAAGIGHAAGRMAWRPAVDAPADETAAASALHLDDGSTAEALLAALDTPEGVQP